MMKRRMVCVALMSFSAVQATVLLDTNFDGATPNATTSDLDGVAWTADAAITASGTLTSVTGHELSNVPPAGAAFAQWTDNVGVNYNLNTDRSVPRGIVASFSVSSALDLGELVIGHVHTTNTGHTQVGQSDMTVTLRNVTDSVDVFTDTTNYDYDGVFDPEIWLRSTYDLSGISLEAGQDYTLTLTMDDLVGGGAYATWNQVTLTGENSLVSENLFTYWKLNETSGSTAYDSSGLNHNGTLSGNAAWTTTGKSDGALEFDGSGDKAGLDLPDTQWPQYTVSLWAKANVTNQATYTSVFNNNSDGSDFQIEADDGTYEYRGSSTVTMGAVTANWIHLAVVCDGISTYVYYNGSQIASIPVADNDFGQLQIASNRAGDYLFNGSIDDVQVYTAALSDNQILWLYDNPGHAIVELPKTVNPIPSDGHSNVAVDTDLSWDITYMNEFTPSYNVYWGTESGNLTLVSPLQAGQSYHPSSALQASTLYCWRVDIVDQSIVPETVYPGQDWCFSTLGLAMKTVEWKMESAFAPGSDWMIEDTSGLGNDGIFINPPVSGPVFASGLVGNCLELTGSDDSVVKKDASFLPLDDTDSWTMNLYIYLNGKAEDWTRIANVGDDNYRQLFIYRDNEIAFLYQDKYLLLSGTTLDLDRWYMLTVTYDNSYLRLYVDGVAVVSKQLPFTSVDELDPELNMLNYAHAGNFSGLLDEFTFWDNAFPLDKLDQLSAILPRIGDSDGNGSITIDDLRALAANWLTDNSVTLTDLLLEDFQSYTGDTDPAFTAAWQASIEGSSALTLSAGEMTWTYDLETGRDAGLYHWPSSPVDLSQYDQLRLWIFKNPGGTGGSLYSKFVELAADGTLWDIGEAKYPGGLDAIAENTWFEWVIDLDQLQTWDSSAGSVPYDRIKDLDAIHIGTYSENGGSGSIVIDDLQLVRTAPRCQESGFIVGDMNGDCKIGLVDFSILAINWLD